MVLFTWVGHGKRPVHFVLWFFTMAIPGVKKPFWHVFYNENIESYNYSVITLACLTSYSNIGYN